MHNDNAAEMRRCLETCDADAAVKLWGHVSPHLPAPADPLAAIHLARTSMESMHLKLRAYSHRWLLDHGLPSQLPDRLKPKAERMYPREAKAVGISVNFGSETLRPLAVAVRNAMEYAVLESFDDGQTDPAFVKARMLDARKYTMKKLVGRIVEE